MFGREAAQGTRLAGVIANNSLTATWFVGLSLSVLFGLSNGLSARIGFFDSFSRNFLIYFGHTNAYSAEYRRLSLVIEEGSRW